MPQPLHKPLSFQLTCDQIRWLEAHQQQGSVSRSAVLRMALDRLMRLEAPAVTAQQERRGCMEA